MTSKITRFNTVRNLLLGLPQRQSISNNESLLYEWAHDEKCLSYECRNNENINQLKTVMGSGNGLPVYCYWTAPIKEIRQFRSTPCDWLKCITCTETSQTKLQPLHLLTCLSIFVYTDHWLRWLTLPHFSINVYILKKILFSGSVLTWVRIYCLKN